MVEDRASFDVAPPPAACAQEALEEARETLMDQARAGEPAAEVLPRWVVRSLLPMFLSLTMVASHGHAQTAKIVGLGAVRCMKFTQEVQRNPAIQRDYLAWAQGYMSGLLIGRPPGVDVGLDLNPSTFPLLKQLEFLRDYCDQHPSAGFADAVQTLYKRLREEGAT